MSYNQYIIQTGIGRKGGRKEWFREILEQAMEEGRKEIATMGKQLLIYRSWEMWIKIIWESVSIPPAAKFSARGIPMSASQSGVLSKVISLAAALEVCGFDKVFAKVGMEPSGDAFNSLVKLDLTSNYPYNPMINSGAIAVASYLMPVVSFEEMLQFSKKLCLDAEIILG